MDNVKGIEKISARIISEAEDYSREKIENAECQAKKIISSAEEKAEKLSVRILSAANDTVSAVFERAGASGRAVLRNARLALKNELSDKAFARANEKFCVLPDEKYTHIMANLLAKTADEFLSDGECATVAFGRRDGTLYDEILSQARKINAKAEYITPDGSLSEECGFVIAKGDVEVNCTAKSIINASHDRLCTRVSDILFSGKEA